VNIHDLTEASLSLLPRELPRIRGSYGAFIITMHPEDFLRLTASPKDRPHIENRPFPKDEHPTPGRFPLPYLNIEWPSGKIRGHEGRHRALMISRQGGKSFPVIIYMRMPDIFWVTYKEENEATGVWTEHAREFNHIAEAEAFMKRLKEQPEEDVYYWQVRMEREGGQTVKGSPNFTDPSDPWHKKPYEISDMPKQLIAEYDDDIRVADFRVGLVKGYSHFR
jgi:hypothetical protein